MWCDVDVVEFSYFGAPEPTPKEQLYTEIVDDLRGSDPCVGSGSQVCSSSVFICQFCLQFLASFLFSVGIKRDILKSVLLTRCFPYYVEYYV